MQNKWTQICKHINTRVCGFMYIHSETKTQKYKQLNPDVNSSKIIIFHSFEFLVEIYEN